MRFLIGSDEDRPVVAHLAARLREKGHEATVAPVTTWGAMAKGVAERVAKGEFDQGVVCCWTGTGASIAANKVPGVRAALCTDAATAAGARKWNDANVLALSLRLLSEPVADEIVDAWLDGTYAGSEDESLKLLR
ncbi:MAG: RpiB/LacA/LacB family sugar-phosphate isomerase [Labilithrix sp.]|nr:RpiB/LacA/LacB family sugar-phosphate isomerase [Labilithrix sp.]MCW5813041.1 RpiB/LacA/LacB family sugar-phosphate isomerase [Labilithrix sp.]